MKSMDYKYYLRFYLDVFQKRLSQKNCDLWIQDRESYLCPYCDKRRLRSKYDNSKIYKAAL